ncbi:Hypothetical protein PENO1_044650 [Penicillium occitanis (nom. inval.)]|nr:Hypothetical protein PENO1_044650 [Penicillium occitanis (nom. inval.)]PCH08200.1 hypothetical protein PENOC_015690 [Penicillium occitanis (nom. inval.)]
MAEQYDVTTYLLDKENIRDTILRMMFAYDHRLPLIPTLVNQVYTPSITINYPRRLIGNGKEEMTSQTWAERLEHFHDGFDSTEHVIQNLLAHLPQPSLTTTRPETCKVNAYAHGLFYRNDEEGLPRVMARRQAGYYDLEMVRVKEIEERGENPWRIKVQNVVLDWQDLPSA